VIHFHSLCATKGPLHTLGGWAQNKILTLRAFFHMNLPNSFLCSRLLLSTDGFQSHRRFSATAGIGQKQVKHPNFHQSRCIICSAQHHPARIPHAKNEPSIHFFRLKCPKTTNSIGMNLQKRQASVVDVPNRFRRRRRAWTRT